MSTQPTIVKVYLNDDTRRFTYDKCSAKGLLSHTSSVFETAISKLQWRDEDGDLITVATDADLAEAINVADGKPLKLICSSAGPSGDDHEEELDAEEAKAWLLEMGLSATTILPATTTTSNTTTSNTTATVEPTTATVEPTTTATTTTTTTSTSTTTTAASAAATAASTFPTTTTASATLPGPAPAPACELTADDGTEWSLWLDSNTNAGTANDWARLEAQLQSPLAGGAGWVTAMRKYRRMLSRPMELGGTYPHLKEIVKAGVVPRFVEFLKLAEQPVLQFEAAWALTNIAAGDKDDTQAVVQTGAIVHFIDLLESPSSDVREQAVWALGNIAGDGPPLRDVLNQHGVLKALLRFLNDTSTTVATIRIATWTVSNLCRGKVPPPDFAVVSESLPTLTRLLNHADDEVVTEACWALSYLSDGTNDKIQTVIETGPMRRLVELLSHSSTKIVTPALRTVGNIVTGNDEQTQEMLFASPDLMPSLDRLLSHTKKQIQKEVCWTISNITAGTTTQIQAVMDSCNVFPRIIDLVNTRDYDIKVRKEATWAIANATSGGRPDQIRQLVAAGCIPSLFNILDVDDHKVVDVALTALGNILKVKGTTSGGDLCSYAAEIKEYLPTPGFTKIASNVDLKYSEAVVQKAVTIMTACTTIAPATRAEKELLRMAEADEPGQFDDDLEEMKEMLIEATGLMYADFEGWTREGLMGLVHVHHILQQDDSDDDDDDSSDDDSNDDGVADEYATDLFGLNEQTKYKTTSIMIAASLGHCDILAALLEAGGNAIDHSIANKFGYTALMWATENNHVEAVKLLLESRAQQIKAEAQ